MKPDTDFQENDYLYLQNRLVEKDQHIDMLKKEIGHLSTNNRKLSVTATDTLSLCCLLLMLYGENKSDSSRMCYTTYISNETAKMFEITPETNITATGEHDRTLITFTKPLSSAASFGMDFPIMETDNEKV